VILEPNFKYVERLVQLFEQDIDLRDLVLVYAKMALPVILFMEIHPRPVRDLVGRHRNPSTAEG